jgi:putative ABC transport system permease protein
MRDLRAAGAERTLIRLLRGYAFTIAGIAVGVAGLVALGAMAERIVRFIEGGDRFVLGQISVAGKGLGMGVGFTAGGLLPASKIREIAALPGVAGVQAQIMLPLETSTSQWLTLTQQLVLGLDLSVPMPNRHYRSLPVRTGRFLRPEDRRVTVLGADFATSRGLAPGEQIMFEGTPYTVVGVLDRMLTAPDRFAMVSIQDARDLLLAKDPMLRNLGIDRGDLNTGAAVGWAAGEDPDAVARRIAERVADVNVTLPSELSRTLRSSTAFFSALLLGIGVLGLVIGGLSLSNTVAAAVFERIRDFGIKRALGATDLQLGREILAEAVAVSLSGGAAGVALAMAVGFSVNAHVARQGQQLFVFSPRLLGFALAFALVLGAAAAGYATLRVVRLSPAEAIRRGT